MARRAAPAAPRVTISPRSVLVTSTLALVLGLALVRCGALEVSQARSPAAQPARARELAQMPAGVGSMALASSSARATAPERATVEAWGTVVDIAGAPLAALRIVEADGDARELGLSDALGRFPWPNDSRSEALRIDDPSWEAVLSPDPRSARAGNERRLVAARVSIVRGSVHCAGVPIADARVVLAWDEVELRARHGAALSWVAEAATCSSDSAGGFEVRAPLEFEFLALRAAHPEFEPRRVALAEHSAPPLSIELRARAARWGQVHGRVQRPDGSPAGPDAQVECGRNGARVASDGSFVLRLDEAPQDAQLRWRARGHVAVQAPLPLDATNGQALTLTLGPRLETLVCELSGDARRHLKDARIELYASESAPSALQSRRVGGDGRVRFDDLEPGHYWLSAIGGGIDGAVRLGPFSSGRRHELAQFSF